MSPGERLRAIREAMPATQRQVARACYDVSDAAVSKWETGKSTPDRRHALALDEFFGTGGEIATMFGYTSGSPAPDRVAELEARLDALTARVEQLEARPALRLAADTGNTRPTISRPSHRPLPPVDDSEDT